MRAIFIYDLSDIFYMLEMEVIRRLVSTRTLGLGGHTVNDVKLIWLRDRLEEMKLMTFNKSDDSPNVQTLRWTLRNLSGELDKLLYSHLQHIPHYYLQTTATLEIRGNDLYVSFGADWH